MPEPVSQNEILIEDVGNTYQADHVLKNGNVPKSALDHVYCGFQWNNLIINKSLVRTLVATLLDS